MARKGAPRRLSAENWVQAALSAISEGGLTAVAVEPLARVLSTTKGSFYWHFDNREALVAAALAAWETGETVAVKQMLAPLPDPQTRLRVLLQAALDDRLGARVEAGLLTDSTQPAVRAVLERATRARTAYVARLFDQMGLPDSQHRATTTFALYLGLLHMRRAKATAAPKGKALDRYVTHLCDWLTAP